MSNWPVPYVPLDDPTGSTEDPPQWTPTRIVEAGFALALRLVADAAFADEYLLAVKTHYRNRADYTAKWASLIGRVYTNPDRPAFNAHDFANIHRAAWILAVAALSNLVGANPYGGWGDPPNGKTQRRAIFKPPKHGPFMFEVPNATGYYALAVGNAIDIASRLTGAKLSVPPLPKKGKDEPHPA